MVEKDFIKDRQKDEEKEFGEITMQGLIREDKATLERANRKARQEEVNGMDLRGRSIPNMPKGGMPTKATGPKGVKADYEKARRAVKSLRMMDQVRKERIAIKMLQGNTIYNEDTIQPGVQQKGKIDPNYNKPKDKYDDTSSDDSDSDFNDDNVFEEYKKKTIETLEEDLPKFDSYNRVEPEAFKELVRVLDNRITLVCVVYENHLENCVRLNFAFDDLAKNFPHTCFVRIPSTELFKNGYNEEGLPTLIVYKGGKMIENDAFIGITRYLPNKFTDQDVVAFLQKYKLIGKPRYLFMDGKKHKKQIAKKEKLKGYIK